jgi:S-DNA-T family DNA segregation ATPase FtsK/SpoIIIE
MAADLTMQMVGIAATAVLVPIGFWGWRLMSHRRLERLGLRLLLWMVGVGFAAAFASLLPATDRWPLPSGLGGVVGDAILTLPRKLSGGFGPIMVLTGLISAVTALLALSASSGFFIHDEGEASEDGELAARSRASDDDDAAGEPGFFLVALGATIHGFLSLSASIKRGITALLPSRETTAPVATKRVRPRQEPRFEPVEEPAPIEPLESAPRPSRAPPAPRGAP